MKGSQYVIDCEKRGAVKFRYNVQRDTGNFKRKSKFYIDKSVPKRCQQLSTKSYKHKHDRGHLVPANHLDYSKKAIKQSNYMTNILPQAANMNRVGPGYKLRKSQNVTGILKIY